MDYYFYRDESAAAGVRRIAAEQLDRAIAHLESPEGERDEGVHEARKCLKRLRALVQLVRFAVGDEVYRRENACFRDVGLRLSTLRDATVLLETLERIVKAAGRRVRRDRFAAVRRWLEERREAAYRQQPVGGEALAGIVNQLRWARVRVDDWSLAPDGWKGLERGLQQVYARGRKGFAQTCLEPRDEVFHEWRKWAKYLWYHTQLLIPLWPPVMEAVAAQLDELGEVLGHDHDLSVLRRTVQTELSRPIRASTLQILLELIDGQQQVLRQQAWRLGSRIYVERGRDFVRRQRRYWQAWKGERPTAMPEKERAKEPELIADCACQIGENPLWHSQEKRVYWVDIPLGRIFRWDRATGQHEQCYEGGVIGGFTIQQDGALLLFMARGAIAIWRGDDRLEYVVEEIPDERESRFNDVIADPAGRVFCGTMPTREFPGRLYRLDRDGSLTRLLEGIGCANGMGFAPDHRRFYFTDSAEKAIYQFDYDPATGDLSNQRVFVDSSDQEGVPDGLTVDAEGCVWSARWDGGCLIRYTPEGKEERRISFPARKVSSLTFGGEDWSEIYVTTAGGDHKEAEGAGAGALFRLNLGIRGMPEFCSRVGI